MPPHRRNTHRFFLAALAILPLCGGLSLQAQEVAELPRGMPVGPWILAPYFDGSVVADDNVFRSPDAPNTVCSNDSNRRCRTDVDCEIRPDELPPTCRTPESDRITSVTGGVVASLPIRNSILQLDYEGNFRRYAENTFQRDLAHDFGLGFEMNFSSGDQLVIGEHYSLGISDIQTIDPGGGCERVFDGQPFTYNRFDVEVSRNVQDRRGYTVQLSRVDLVYDDQGGFEFFDYRGYEGSGEYRHPLPGRLALVGYYGFRRFDHFLSEDEEIVYAPGEPYRRERYDSAQLGIQGFIGRRQPFYVRLGTARFSYDWLDRDATADFSGLVGAASWRLSLGTKSTMEIDMQRRPLPSNFETYYIINELRLKFARRWLRRSRFGLNLLASVNRYGDLIGGEPELRRDQRQSVEGYLDWFFRGKIGVRVALARQRRRSNFAAVGYDATVLTTGFRVGWF